jgi:asparagine synthase (glutamine-hydrolysing)
MCGIAGALDLNGQREFPREILANMTGAIAHRGPDDEGFRFEPGVALGARRLSIVDLEGGSQPLCNENGQIWVAFNGELFDYPELQRDLAARGHTLRTRCDTECWVHLYEDHGAGMLDHAKGQFAVSLWDRPSRTLILGRDRPGIVPLYYAEVDGWLLWASEIKALLRSGMVNARMDPKGIDHLFSFFCTGTTRTFFAGVKSLPPGHYIKVVNGRLSVHRYWDLNVPAAGEERRVADPRELIDELEEKLQRAVRKRLRGDVPVVSYISGGLDSTVVLGLTRHVRGKAVPSFTIGFDKAGPDERSAATESAAALGSDLTTLTLNRRDLADAFPELIVAAEGPVLDTSCAALMRLAGAVSSQGYKVTLTGEGADEALAGYMWYRTQKLRDFVNSVAAGRMITRSMRWLALKGIGGASADTGGLELRPCVRPAQQDMYEFIRLSRPLLYSDQLKSRLVGHSSYTDLDFDHPQMTKWHPLNQSLYLGYKAMLAGLLMVPKGDRIAMHNSIETRYPFLDEDVIEFCASIAPEYKLKGRREKWLLRQVAAKTLPKRLANRPKTMFRASLSGTFLGPERPAWVDQLLSPESLRKAGWFDPAAVAAEVRKQTSMPRVTIKRFVMDVALTCVVSTQLFHHLYLGGGLCELPQWDDPGFAGNRKPSDHYRVREASDLVEVLEP